MIALRRLRRDFRGRLFATLVGALALSGPSLVAAPAWSDEAPSADEDVVTLGRYHYERGVELFRRGDYQGARDAFTESARLTPYAIVHYNLGLTHAALGDPMAAEQELVKAVASPGALSAARLAAAKQALEEQRKKLGSLRVDCAEPEVEIWLDGMQRGTTPFSEPLRVKAGSVIAELQKQGYAAERRRVTIAPGATQILPCELEPTDTGWIRVRSHIPGAEVRLDGVAVGRTPLDRSFSVSAGSHTLELRRDGYLPTRKGVSVGKGDAVELVLPLAEDPQRGARGLLVLRREVDDVDLVVDGVRRGRAGAPLQLPAGPHHVEAESGGYQPFVRDVDIPAGDRLLLDLALEPTPDMRAEHAASASTVRTWSWILTLGGAAIVAGNVVYLVVNEGSRDDALAALDAYRQETNTPGAACYKNPPGACEARLNTIVADESAASDRRIPGFIGIAVGGVITGAGVLGFLLGDDPHRFDPPPQGEEFRAGEVSLHGLRPTFALGPDGFNVGARLAL